MQIDPVQWLATNLPVGWVRSNLGLVLFGVIAVVAIAWAYDAYDEADDRREALSGFAGRARSGTGGVLNIVLVSLVAVVGWAATVFETSAEAFAFLVSLVPQLPSLTASLFTIGLGALGLSGAITLRPVHFVAIALAAVGLAEAYRRDLKEARRS
ncbi:hypothetical protein GWK26_11855 [haloarchaeon 3A1-DGR]|nr:hypothetical protein GWK26_11855 [haloarchaeon 3A1-DGR]